MWRELEVKRRSGKPDETRTLRELTAGDTVRRGDRYSGVTVTIIDDDHANVRVSQQHLRVSVGEEIDRSTMNPTDSIMPYDARRIVEKDNVHISGISTGLKHTVVEWYPSK